MKSSWRTGEPPELSEDFQELPRSFLEASRTLSKNFTFHEIFDFRGLQKKLFLSTTSYGRKTVNQVSARELPESFAERFKSLGPETS